MKRRGLKLGIIAAAAVCVLSSAVFAVNGEIPGIGQQSEGKNSVAYSAKNINEQLSMEKNDSFKKNVDILKSRKMKDDDFYRAMLSYAGLLKIYNPGASEIKYLDKLIAEGCDMERVVTIYKFWCDTDEDITLIKKIYDKYDPAYANSDIWIEDAFNEITNHKYGELDADAVKEYNKKGAGYDDIVTANRLSRLGKMTIQQILDSKLGGKSWVEIADSIYSNSSKRDRFAINRVKMGDYKKISKGSEVLDAIFLAPRTGKNVDHYLSRLATGESVLEDKQQYYDIQGDIAFNSLKAQGLWDETAQVKLENNKTYKKLRDKIKQYGLADSDIEGFKKAGYTDLDILNAAEIGKKHGATPGKVLQGKDKGRSWQDMAEKGVE